MNRHSLARLCVAGPGVIALAFVGSTAFLPASASAGVVAGGAPSSTTLDACGYFTGEQAPLLTYTGGATTIQVGTWTGVTNNYSDTPVASLGKVRGAFTEITTTYGLNGQDTEGNEAFTSNAGQIFQTFRYGPDVSGGFSVSVVATRALSFLTSTTNGACYSGPFPRP